VFSRHFSLQNITKDPEAFQTPNSSGRVLRTLLIKIQNPISRGGEEVKKSNQIFFGKWKSLKIILRTLCRRYSENPENL
jgi:hypothetical protein